MNSDREGSMATWTYRPSVRPNHGPVGGAERRAPVMQTDESLLRTALECLRPFLADLGLKPSRVLAYMRQDKAFQHFPAQIQMILRNEANEECQSAASFLADELTSEHAPPGILSHFMLSLLRSNYHPSRPNEGAWRVHDVLVLACAYMPLQLAILRHLQDIDLNTVTTDLMGHKFLTVENMTRVMDTVVTDREEAVVIQMLSYIYANMAETMRESYKRSQPEEEGRNPERFQELCKQVFGRLTTLLQILQRRGDGSLHTDIPAAVLAPETWSKVCSQLSFLRRLSPESMSEGQDAVSEAGESVAGSDLTLVEHDGGDNGYQNAAPGVQEGAQLPANNVNDARLQRTINFIHNTRGAQEQLPYFIEFIKYEKRAMERDDRLQARVGRSGDSSSGTGTTSTSTEDNTAVRQYDDIETRELARILRYTGLSEDAGQGPGQITLRDYQNELLQWVRERKNAITVLPTGTGKTFIVLKYTQEVLSRPGTQRIVFMAPKVKLAEQQYSRFLHFFPKITYFRSGRTSNTTCYAPFGELLDLYRVFVMTPQCLVESILRKEARITDFSLFVLDECHHAMGKHSYKVLMDLYMDSKFSKDTERSDLPQVIGLTASPGVGKGGTLDIAMAHLKELCYNLDAEAIFTVKQHEEELKSFVNEPTHEIRICTKRKKDEFKRIIEKIMKNAEDDLVKSSSDIRNPLDKDTRELVDAILKAPAKRRGQMRYSEWASNVNIHVAGIESYSRDAYIAAFSTTEMLLRYQQALILNEDCESQYALDYLLEQARLMEEQEMGVSDVERQLLEHLHAHVPDLQKTCKDTDDHNPKLRMLEDILLQMWDKNQDKAACMVFVRTLELSKAIRKWIQNHPDLKQLNPGRITGSRKSNKHGGMTRNELADVLQDFNSGKHKVVICTSAAEEGLDFQACNVVVRYDYVTHMISMVQTRGRARRMESQYCVLGNQLQGNLEKENENVANERLMRRAMAKVQDEMDANINAFLHEMGRQQKLEWVRRQREAENKQRKRRAAQENDKRFILKCSKCKEYACASTDFRLLEESNRIVIAEDFAQRWKRVECEPERYSNNLVKIAKVHCKGKRCSLDWGCVARYIPSGHEFPVLKLEKFLLHDQQAGKIIWNRKIKWSDNLFYVEAITEDELCSL